MSTGHAKKPISKKTSALLAGLQRRHGIRELAKRVLIVCEDDKSAPNYFKALKRHFNLSATSVVIAGSGGSTQPIQVVERAKSLKESAQVDQAGTEPFEYVWCVIDGDYGAAIANARSSANAHGISLAISTKCFEFWISLHLEDCAIPCANCDEVVRGLRDRHLPDYDKGQYDFGELVQSVLVASERAKRNRQQGISRGDLPENQNPCTEVYKIVDLLLANPSA